MKVAVIGLGSMGKRRIRLIKLIDKSIEITGVDLSESRRKEAEEKFSIATVGALDELAPEIKTVFVSTSPLSHAAIINQCLRRGMNVFTELNLVADMYDENIALAKEKGAVLFLSSTWLYREEVRYIQNEVDKSGCRCNYCYHVGQYLPDWHPWESYKSFFVGDRRTNGCRELMAIELPWLIKTFGKVESFNTAADKMTSLDIDYPDNYLIQLKHESGAKGMLAIDVAARKAVRNLEIYGEKLYISWNGSPDGLYRYNHVSKDNENILLYSDVDKQEAYSASIIENAYRSEINAYFTQIENGSEPVYGFEDDKEILKLIDRIETEGQRK